MFVLYYINNYLDGWLVNAFTSMPKLIALAVAILALMFPHDYEKIPDILSNTYSKFTNINKPRSKKRNVGESIKKYVASHQQWKCNDCKQMLDATYEIDHIRALYKGGSNDIRNLQALCRNCHGRKTLIDNIMK